MITIRPFCETDLEWVKELLIYGTKQKHFSSFFQHNTEPMLKDVLSLGSVMFRMDRNGLVVDRPRRIDIIVAEVDGFPASFLYCAHDEDGSVELHLAATKKEFRRRGCFTLLVKNALEKYSNISKFYVRCYEKSTFAKDALKKLNFTPIPTSKLITTFTLQR